MQVSNSGDYYGTLGKSGTVSFGDIFQMVRWELGSCSGTHDVFGLKSNHLLAFSYYLLEDDTSEKSLGLLVSTDLCGGV